MLVLNRHAIIESSERALDAEYKAARWTHHRLLDFELEHQRVLDETAENAAPGITQVSRILGRLSYRAKRAARTPEGTWAPDPRPELAAALRKRLQELRSQRNADPRWKAALGWADDQVGDPKKIRRRRAKAPGKVKRRKGETDDAWAKRFALLTTDETEEHYQAKLANPPRDSRRDQHRKRLYRETHVYWGTWNALSDRVDRARADVLKRRKAGMGADWHRPRFASNNTIAANSGGVEVTRDGKRLRVRQRLGEGWVTYRMSSRGKLPKWFDVDRVVSVELTRRRDGERWRYTASLVVDAEKDVSEFATRGTVALDWGHREHDHPHATEGLRVFTWLGDDGRKGNVILPIECRLWLDTHDALRARMDTLFNARKSSLGLSDRNRHGYRRRLMHSGVRTEEEARWLQWEMRYERRAAKARKRAYDLRSETYHQAVRELRRHYRTFVVETEHGWSLRKLQAEEQIARRTRSNRELSARYEFLQLCERSGAVLAPEVARDSTRECPDCETLAENGPERLVTCPGCGRTRDKDEGACRVLLARWTKGLADDGEAV